MYLLWVYLFVPKWNLYAKMVINAQGKSPNSFIQQIFIEHLHYAGFSL